MTLMFAHNSISTRTAPAASSIVTLLFCLLLFLPGQALAMGQYLTDVMGSFPDTSRVHTCGNCHADWGGARARGDMAVNYKMWDYSTKNGAMEPALELVDVMGVGVTNADKILLANDWTTFDTTGTGGTTSGFFPMSPLLGQSDKDGDGCVRLYYRTERAGMPLQIVNVATTTGTANGELLSPPSCWDLDDNDPNNGNVGPPWGTAYNATTLGQHYSTTNDNAPAGSIHDLRMSAREANALPLAWTAPSDDDPDHPEVLAANLTKEVHHYDIRYTTETIMNSFAPVLTALATCAGLSCDVRNKDHWHGMYDRSDCGINNGAGQAHLMHQGSITGPDCPGGIGEWNRGVAAPLMRAMYEPTPAVPGVTEAYTIGELGVVAKTTYSATGAFADAAGRGVNYIQDGQLYWLTAHSTDGRIVINLDATFTGPFTANGAAGFSEPGFSDHGNIIGVTAGGAGVGYSISSISLDRTASNPADLAVLDATFTVTGWGLEQTTPVSIEVRLFDNSQVAAYGTDPYTSGTAILCPVDSRATDGAGLATLTVTCPTRADTPVSLYDIDVGTIPNGGTAADMVVKASRIDALDVYSDVLPGDIQFNESVIYDIIEDSLYVDGKAVKLTRTGGKTGAISVEFYVYDDAAVGTDPATPGTDYAIDVYPQSSPLVISWANQENIDKYVNLSATTGLLAPDGNPFANGVAPQNLIVDDLIVDHTETLRVAIQNVTIDTTGDGVPDTIDNSLIGSFNDSVLNIKDNDNHGTLDFVSSVPTTTEGHSGITTVAIDVDRLSGAVGEVSVDFVIDTNVPGSGIYDVDFKVNGTEHPDFVYDAASGTGTGKLTWANTVLGVQPVKIDVFGDYAIEADVLADITLGNPLFNGAVDAFDDVLGTNNVAILTITDDDGPGSFNLEASRTIMEGDANWSTTVTITRTDGATGQINLPYAVDLTTTALASDYTITNTDGGTLIFLEGEVSKTINIDILTDRDPEADKFIDFSLGTPDNGAVLGGQTTMRLTIQDDDSRGIVQYTQVYDMSNTNTTEDSTLANRTFTFVVERADELDGTVGNDGVVWVDFEVESPQLEAFELGVDYTISFDGIEGTDYTFDTVTSTGQFFWADQSQSTHTVTVIALKDEISESGGEGVDVHMLLPTDLGGGVTVGSNSHAHGHIYDSVGTVQFEFANYLQPEFDGVTPTVTMVATRTGTRGAVIASFIDKVDDPAHTSTKASDYSISIPVGEGSYDSLTDSGTLSWADGVGTNRSIEIIIADDNLVEGDEAHIMQITNTTVDGAANNVIGAVPESLLAIADDDNAGALRYELGHTNPSNVTENKVSLAVDSDSHNVDGYFILDIERVGGQDGQVTVDYFIDTHLTTAPGSATYDTSEVGTQTDGLVDFWIDTVNNGNFVFNNTTLTGVGTLTWNDQDAAIKTIKFNIIDDIGVDPGEYVKVTLQNVSDDAPALGASPNIATITAPTDFRVNLFDDDAPGHVMFNSWDSATLLSLYDIQEDNATTVTATLMVMRMAGSAGEIRVDYNTETTPGTATVVADYIATSGTLLFPDGALGAQPITITINSETPYEALETIIVTLSNPTLDTLQTGSVPTADNTVLGQEFDGTEVATLTVTDSPGYLQFTAVAQSVVEGDVLSGSSTISAIVTRYGGSGGAVTADFLPLNVASTAISDDYTINTASPLSWISGEGGISGDKPVSITVTPDTVPEDDNTLVFDLTSPVGGVVLSGLDQLSHTVTISNDDNGGEFNFVTTTATVNEDDTSALFDFVVQRVGGSDGDATVVFSLAGQGGSPAKYGANNDYSVSLDTVGGDTLSGLDGAINASGNLYFADGVVSKTIRVIVYNDELAESLAESVLIQLTDVTSTIGEGTAAIARLAATSLAATINFGDAIGELQFKVPTSYNVNEYDALDVPSTDTVLVYAERVKGTRSQVSIGFGVAGVATKTTDYTILASDVTTIGTVAYDELTSSGTLTWNDGQSGAIDVDITTVADNDIEGDETVVLQLDGTSISAGATMGLNTSATANIIDNDIAGTFQFSVAASGAVNEAGETATAITIKRLNGTDSTVSLNLVIDNTGISNPAIEADVSIYQVTPGDTVFAGGIVGLSWIDGEADKVIIIKAVDDAAVEEDQETIQFKLASISSPSSSAVIGAPVATIVGVNNDDIAGTLQFSAPTFFVGEDSSIAVAAQIDVTRTAGEQGVITVDYTFGGGTATAGVDYDNTVTSGTLTWDHLNATGATQSFFITINTDLINEPGGETINLSLSNPTSFSKMGAQNAAVLQVNDTVGEVVFDVLNPVLAESDVSELASYTYNIQVNRINGTYGDLVFNYLTRDGDTGISDAVVGADYNAVLGTQTFANTELVKFIQLTILNDTNVEEPDERLYIDVEEPLTSAVWSTAAISIDSEDAIGSATFNGPPATVLESDGTISIPLQRINGKAGSLTVYVSTDVGSATAEADYTAINKQPVTFPAGVLTSSLDFTLLDDSSDELAPDETVDLVLYGSDSSTEIDRWTINIQDDDIVYSGISVAPGWSMVSIPTNLVQSNMLNLFYDDLKDNPTVIYKWNSSGTPATFAGSYELAYSATIAQGYFVNNQTGATAFMDDQYNGVLTGNFSEFQLQVGGNMIGSPYQTDGVTIAHRDLLTSSHASFCRVTDVVACTLDTDWVDYSAAVASGWVANAIYRYNTVLGSYDVKSTVDLSMTLPSWEGYWFRTEVGDNPLTTGVAEVLKMRLYNPSVAP